MQPIDCCSNQDLNAKHQQHSGMAEALPPRIGLRTGVQAGAFIGLFLGFSLAVVSALTDPDALVRLVQLMCFTPMASAVILGPFLGWRRAPLMPVHDPLDEVRGALQKFAEGQGKWRPLSHVRSDGRAVRIDLHNSSQPLAIVSTTLPFADRFPVRYVVGRGEVRSRDPMLRQQVLAYVEQHVDLSRRKRTSANIEVMPVSIIEHLEATHRMHRRLFYLLPIILFFAWLEMR
jgi:hypothetical protein